MAPDDERRDEKRVEFAARVLLKMQDEGALQDYLAKNLSNDGIFVKTSDPLPKGKTIELRVVDINGEVLFEAAATVMWNRTPERDSALPPGMGLRFENLSEESMRIVHQLVRVNPAVGNRQIMQGGESTSVGPGPTETKPEPIKKQKKQKKKVRATKGPQKKRAPVIDLSGVVNRVTDPRSRPLLIGIAAGVILLPLGIWLGSYLIGQAQARGAYHDSLQADVDAIESALAAINESDATNDERNGALNRQLPALRKKQRKIAVTRREAKVSMPKLLRRKLAQGKSRFRVSSIASAGTERDGAVQFTRYDIEMFGEVYRLQHMATALFSHGRAMEVNSVEVSLLSFNAGATAVRVKTRVTFYEYAEPQIARRASDHPLPDSYNALLEPSEVTEEWASLGGKKIETAQTRLDDLRARLKEREAAARQMAWLDARAAAYATWETDLDALRTGSDKSRAQLKALAPKLAKKVKVSGTGDVLAKVDPTGKLSIY